MRKALAATTIALATMAAVARAHADDAPPADPRATADALFHEAESEDAAGDYARAVEHYRAAVRALPSFRFAPKAMTRAALLEAHSEGGFVPYARLEAVRRDPKAGDDPAAIDALARDTAAFPPGPTRSEAWMVCAGAYLSRLHRRADGEAALRRAIEDPQADALLKRQAAGQLVEALLSDGDIGGARTTSQEIARWLDPKVAREVVIFARRRWLRVASIADLGLFVALTGWAILRAAKHRRMDAVVRALRANWGLGVAFAGYVAVAGGVLATEYETGNSLPFLVFGAAILPIALLARAWGAAGSPGRAARSARSLVSASAVVAAAFLLLEAINAQYLEGFHL